jgi:hypothetical protein
LFGLLFEFRVEMMVRVELATPVAQVRARARQTTNVENPGMVANVGRTDRMLRIVVGIMLLALFFILQGPARYLGILGLVALGTGLVSFCPLYALLGINTCPKK